jgi:hypothetical protein
LERRTNVLSERKYIFFALNLEKAKHHYLSPGKDPGEGGLYE